MQDRPSGLPQTLRQARQAQRLSQQELSFRLGVSQRHLSCVECGRAQPSRALLLAWLQALALPLGQRNAALLQAGLAPMYRAAPPDDPALAQVHRALAQLLQSHDPMPALVLDAEWRVLDANAGARWLMGELLPAELLAGPATPSLLDLLCHPEGLTARIRNLAEVGPQMLARLRAEAAWLPVLQRHADAFEAQLLARLGRRPAPLAGGPLAPVLTTRFASAHGELAFFSLYATFGTPQDISLDSLKVEHLFPADDATRQVLAAQVTPPG
jgi:transcriptional regulator with XRE-family HTH domain